MKENGITLAKIEKLLFGSIFNISKYPGNLSAQGDFHSGESSICNNETEIAQISIAPNKQYKVIINNEYNYIHILAIIVSILISK
jgi:hypothetical protein